MSHCKHNPDRFCCEICNPIPKKLAPRWEGRNSDTDKLWYLLTHEVKSEDGRYTFPDGDTWDCGVKDMICTRCEHKIEKNEKYYRTKRGVHHENCNITDEELARELAGYVLRRVQNHLKLDGAEIDQDSDTEYMRRLIADLKRQFHLEGEDACCCLDIEKDICPIHGDV